MGQNLCLQSEAFDDATQWTKNNATITPNVLANPLDGAMTADRINDDSANNVHIVTTVAGAVLGRVNTYSVYLKAGTLNWAAISANQAAFIVFFDLQNGLRASIAGTGAARANILGVGCEAVVGQAGWYRCWITFFCTNIGGTRIYCTNADGAQSHIGDTTGNIYLYGAQLSLTWMPVPYVATTTTVVNTGTPRSRLPLTQNCISRSQEFDHANWTKFNCSVSANAITAPDGTLSADLITSTGAGSVEHGVAQASVGVTPGYRGRCTASAWLKIAAGTTWVSIRSRAGAVVKAGWFNLSTGVLGSTSSNVTSKMTDYGNGWYLCEISFTSSVAEASCDMQIAGVPADLSSMTYTQAGEAVHAWGAQLSQTDAMVPYIATTSVAHDQGTPRTPLRALQNLLKQSQDLGNAAWTKTRVTAVVTSGGGLVTGPNGAADIVTDDNTNATHFITQTSTLDLTKARATIVAYAKAGTCSWIGLFGHNTSGIGAYFDLTNGVLGTVDTGFGVRAAIGSVPGFPGWWRCQISYPVSNTTVTKSAVAVMFMASGNGVITYTGGLTVYLNGLQLSQTEVALLYAPTTSAVLDLGTPRSQIPRQNLLVRSQDVGNASWSKTRTTAVVTSGGSLVAGPNGAADIITAGNNGSTTYFISQVSTLTLTVARATLDVFLKAGTASIVMIGGHGSSGCAAWFNLSTGAIGTQVGGVRATMEAVPGFAGWYRCSVSYPVAAFASRSATVIVNICDADGSTTHAGNGTIYTNGSQLTQTDGATGYVATTSNTVDIATPRSPLRMFQNLAIQSDAIDSASWVKNNVTVPAGSTNIALSPSTGGVTADALFDSVDGAPATHFIAQTINANIGAVVTLSVFAKASGRNFVVIAPNGAALQQSFDLSTGQVGTTIIGTNLRDKGMEAVPGYPGWYRCWVTFVFSNNTQRIYSADVTGSVLYTGAGSNAILLAGIQFTLASGLTPYIATTTAVVDLGTPRSLIAA